MGNESFSKTRRRGKNIDIYRNYHTTTTIFAIQNDRLIRFKIDQNRKIETERERKNKQ